MPDAAPSEIAAAFSAAKDRFPARQDEVRAQMARVEEASQAGPGMLDGIIRELREDFLGMTDTTWADMVVSGVPTPDQVADDIEGSWAKTAGLTAAVVALQTIRDASETRQPASRLLMDRMRLRAQAPQQ